MRRLGEVRIDDVAPQPLSRETAVVMQHFEADDHVAFSELRLTLSERCLELVMRTMAEKYPRPQHNFVADFELPWNAHFS
jgi:hypothetical protein